jgi:aminoglycoside phosphotransferase
MTRIAGAPGHEAAPIYGTSTTIDRFAAALSRIHALPIQNCPFTSTIAIEFETAVRNVRAGRVNAEAFEREVGERPAVVLDRLESEVRAYPEDTFTHGDYCLPNILLSDHGDGIIDWGIGGISDRYRDFMSVELTIRRNFGPEYIPKFYRAYGESEIDDDRRNFYWLLDRFSNHLEAG